ncbi:DUF4113 domain-containing protein [Pantoea agglomerans]
MSNNSFYLENDYKSKKNRKIIDTKWKMKQQMLSTAWITCWSDIPVARV